MMILFLHYILIFSQIEFLTSFQVFNRDTERTLWADRTMRMKSLDWHRNFDDNSTVPFFLALSFRRNICDLIFQYPTTRFNYDTNAPFMSTVCFEMDIVQSVQEDILHKKAILCPCPKVLGYFNYFYLVKGPENMSVLVYVLIANEYYVNFAYAIEIEDNNFNPLIGQRHLVAIFTDSSPPTAVRLFHDNDNNNNNNNNNNVPLQSTNSQLPEVSHSNNNKRKRLNKNENR